MFPPYIPRKTRGSSQHLPPPPSQMQTVFHIGRDPSSSTCASHADLNQDWQWTLIYTGLGYVPFSPCLTCSFIQHAASQVTPFLLSFPSQQRFCNSFTALFYYTEGLSELQYRQHLLLTAFYKKSQFSPCYFSFSLISHFDPDYLDKMKYLHLTRLVTTLCYTNSIYLVWCGFKKACCFN